MEGGCLAGWACLEGRGPSPGGPLWAGGGLGAGEGG